MVASLIENSGHIIGAIGGMIGLASAIRNEMVLRRSKRKDVEMFDVFHDLWQRSLRSQGTGLPIPTDRAKLKLCEEMVQRGLLRRAPSGYSVRFT